MQLEFSRDEILSEQEGLKAHVVGGRTFHGGIDAIGSYVSPRTGHRSSAIRNWGRALRERGGELQPVVKHRSDGIRYPNHTQYRYLLSNGLDEFIWNLFTTAGSSEARGRMLAEMAVPDFRPILEEDPETWALGHLERGLLEAHGLDEGGNPEGPGAHDRMWYMIRDLVMGENRYPIQPEPPEPEVPEFRRRIPGIPEEHEVFVRTLMSVLILELEALPLFKNVEALLLDRSLFKGRRPYAEEAAKLLGRLRQDESLHVLGLRTVLGELRHAHLITPEGTLPGADLFDPVWERHVRFATQKMPQMRTDMLRATLPKWISSRPDGDRKLREFEALAEAS